MSRDATHRRRLVMPRNYARHYRISSLIKEALAPMLASVATNGLFTLREVRINNDFSVATVIYSLIGGDSRETQEKLGKEAGRYRRELAKRLNMRKTPQLVFAYDNEGLAADNMRRFLDSVAADGIDEANDNESTNVVGDAQKAT